MGLLSGYKTYILGASTIVGALAAYFVGNADLPSTAQLIITAGLSMTVRNAISTNKS
jgi:hypothetical protein